MWILTNVYADFVTFGLRLYIMIGARPFFELLPYFLRYCFVLTYTKQRQACFIYFSTIFEFFIQIFYIIWSSYTTLYYII